MTVQRLQQELADGRRTEERLRDSEARFLLLFNSNLLGIMFREVSGKVTGANDAFLQLVGYTKDDLDNGTIEWDRITSAEMQALEATALAEDGATMVHPPIERQFIRKDGRPVTLLFGMSPLAGWNDKLVGFALSTQGLEKFHS